MRFNGKDRLIHSMGILFKLQQTQTNINTRSDGKILLKRYNLFFIMFMYERKLC